MNMFVPNADDPADDHRVIRLAIDQSIWFARLGYNPWYTDHHFRGPWHSNPLQFAAYIIPQIPQDRYLGFGVLSIPFYHPVRLVESMNLLDQLAQGRVMFGVGSGWQGTEPAAFGMDPDYHASGQAAEDMLEVMGRLWDFRYGDQPFSFHAGTNSGHVKRRVMPAPYTSPHPMIIRTASREPALIKAAHRGWPAFLGIFGADLQHQMELYRNALFEADHPQEVIDNCLRWSAYDIMGLTIARTKEEAEEREKRAQAETMAIRSSYIQRHGALDGPVIKPKAGQSTAAGYARGDDMKATIAGTPEMIVEKVKQLADVGINHLLLRFLGEWDGETRYICEESAELFASEVMPHFTDGELTIA